MKMINAKKCAEFLLTHDNILFVTHKNPDGDTLGSAAALCAAMRRAGRRAFICRSKSISYKIMPYIQDYIAPKNLIPGCVVSVDVAEPDLFPECYSGTPDLCIDHHASNSGFGRLNFVQPEKAACGEIVFSIIREIHGDVSRDEANLLYIAISTDTGCFMYANTAPSTFRTAAKLLDCGADAAALNEIFFRKVSAARIKLESLVYGSISVHHGGRTAAALVTREMLEASGVREDELDDVSALVGRVENTDVGITVRELADGSSKISVRSYGKVNSNEICAAFGGGGHKGAAGCTIQAAPAKAKQLILAVTEEILNR